jgi:hypothetical protein
MGKFEVKQILASSGAVNNIFEQPADSPSNAENPGHLIK